MNCSSSINLTVNGNSRQVSTAVLLDDIDRNGIAWCDATRRLEVNGGDIFEQLGTFLNLASICRANGRYIDELGALTRARRVIGDVPEIDEMIRSSSENARFTPSAVSADYRIVGYADNPTEFRGLLGHAEVSNNFYHPGAAFGGLVGVDGRRVIDNDPSVFNVSFHVCRGDRLLATVPLLVHEDNVASWVQWVRGMGGVPAQIFLSELCDNPRKVLRVVLEYLTFLMRSRGLKETVVQEPLDTEMALHKLLIPEYDFSAELWDRAVVDLRESDEALHSGIRKSLKSNVNWCREHLRMEYFSGESLNEGVKRRIYETIQDCHRKLHERYGDGMTQNMFDEPIALCRLGHGEAAIASTSDGAACGVTVTTDQHGIAYYALAGSKPLENKKNPGHFIVFDSILRAKRRGMLTYHVSRTFSAPVSTAGLETRVKTKHELESKFFKRAFSDRIDLQYVYRILPRGLTILGRQR